MRKVEVVSPNLAWFSAFEVEAKAVAAAIGKITAAVHHIVSTAINGTANSSGGLRNNTQTVLKTIWTAKTGLSKQLTRRQLGGDRFEPKRCIEGAINDAPLQTMSLFN